MWTVRRLWLALVAAAVGGCLASLVGPLERWWGVDVGATGSVLFALALVGSTVVAAMRPRDLFPEDWSICEQRAWVGLLFTAIILMGFGKFLWSLGQLPEVPRTLWEVPVHRFVIFLSTPFICWVVISASLARGAGPVEQDERDLRLRHQADRAGDWALTLIVVCCIVLLVNAWRWSIGWWLEPMILANLLVGILIAKALVEQAALVASYARARR